MQSVVPNTIILGWAAGGGVDVLKEVYPPIDARELAEKLFNCEEGLVKHPSFSPYLMIEAFWELYYFGNGFIVYHFLMLSIY